MENKLTKIKRITPLTYLISDGKETIKANEYELREIQLEVKEGLRESGQEVSILEIPEVSVTINENGLLSESISNAKTNLDGIKYVGVGYCQKQMRRFFELNQK